MHGCLQTVAGSPRCPVNPPSGRLKNSALCWFDSPLCFSRAPSDFRRPRARVSVWGASWMPDLMELSVADPIVLPPKRPRSALPGGGRPRGSLSWSDEANFGLGWGLGGPTGGGKIRGGPRAPLARPSRPPKAESASPEGPLIRGRVPSLHYFRPLAHVPCKALRTVRMIEASSSAGE